MALSFGPLFDADLYVFATLLLLCCFFFFLHRWANFGKLSFKIGRVQPTNHLQLGWQIHPHDKLGSRLETDRGMVWCIARGNSTCTAQSGSFSNRAHYYSKRYVSVEMAMGTLFLILSVTVHTYVCTCTTRTCNG